MISGRILLTFVCLSQILLAVTLAAPKETGVDFFPNALMQVAIDTPSGSETLKLTGPIKIKVDLTSLADTDGNGREQVQVKLIRLKLTGTSIRLGPVTLRLRHPIKPPFQRSTGEIEETVNHTLQVLDIPPFAELGVAASFFDVFFEIKAPAAPPGLRFLHNEMPARMAATITQKPPPAVDILPLPEPDEPVPHNIYFNPMGVELVDEHSKPVNILITTMSLTLSPCDSETEFCCQ